MEPTIKCENLSGRFALIPGDPRRAEFISEYLDNAREVAKNREFWTFEGSYRGVNVVVTSTGIGGPSSMMAIEELSNLGIDTFIRVGTCGYIDTEVKAGDLIIVDSAVREEGSSLFSAPIEYPANSSFDVQKALSEAAADSDRPCHSGTVLTADSFYEVGPALEKFEMVKAFEMECAPIFVKCSVNGLRAGAILAVDGKAGSRDAISKYSSDKEIIWNAVEEEIKIALNAVNILNV